MTDTEVELEPEAPEAPEAPEPELLEHPATEISERCEAVTTAGGTEYRCSLQAEHDGEHAFQPVDDTDEEPTAQDQFKQKEKQRRQLENERDRHNNRLVEILGEDYHALVPCELCWELAPGHRWNVAPNEDTVKRVRVAIGLPDISSYLDSPRTMTCPECGGQTKNRTGSLDPVHAVIKCGLCEGRGWVPRPGAEPMPEEHPPTVTTPNGDVPVWDDEIQRDMFGTPVTDPDYGKMPGLRARPIEYWLTNRT